MQKESVEISVCGSGPEPKLWWSVAVVKRRAVGNPGCLARQAVYGGLQAVAAVSVKPYPELSCACLEVF